MDQPEYTLAPGRSRRCAAFLAGLHAGEDSGNARFARTLFEQALNRQALRLSRDRERALDALDRDEVMTLTAEDHRGGTIPSHTWRATHGSLAAQARP